MTIKIKAISILLSLLMLSIFSMSMAHAGSYSKIVEPNSSYSANKQPNNGPIKPFKASPAQVKKAAQRERSKASRSGYRHNRYYPHGRSSYYDSSYYDSSYYGTSYYPSRARFYPSLNYSTGFGHGLGFSLGFGF